MGRSRRVSTRRTVIGLVAGMVFFSLLPWFVQDENVRLSLYAQEGSLVEQVSVVLWLGLAGMLLAMLRPISWRVAAGAVVCVFAAIREADWHTYFTGYSVLKPGYFFHADEPLGQRVLMGAILLGVVVCAVVTILALVGHFRNLGGHRTVWGQHVLVFVAAAALSKVLDRLPNVGHKLVGAPMPALGRQMMKGCEEGLEMLLPVVLGVAIVAFAQVRKERRREGGGQVFD